MNFKLLGSTVLASTLLLTACGADDGENQAAPAVKPEKVNPAPAAATEQKVDMKLKDDKNNKLKGVKIEKNKTYNVPGQKVVTVKGVSLTDFIPVKPDTKFNKNNGGYVFYFDKNKKRIKFEPKEEFPVEVTIPKNTAFVRLSIPNIHMEHAAFVLETAK